MDQASAYYDQEAYCPPDPLILYFQFRLLWGGGAPVLARRWFSVTGGQFKPNDTGNNS